LAALWTLGGCSINDSLDDCPQGIHASFYSLTACEADTLYPAHVADLRMFVFDARGTLAGYGSADEVRSLADYVHTLDARDGWFTVVAWSGLSDDAFALPAPVIGVTTKDEMRTQVRQAARQAAPMGEKRIYYGESAPVFLPDPAEHGSVFERVSVNLLEQTYRVNVEVEGLPPTGEYEILVDTEEGSATFDADGLLTASFTLMQLELGMDATLIIRERATGRELYRGDLLGTLLLKNPGVDPTCDRDFTIRFSTEDQCQCGTYMIMRIWVNDWLVHSYDTDLS
jgi:hypothetical protein